MEYVIAWIVVYMLYKVLRWAMSPKAYKLDQAIIKIATGRDL